MKTHAAFLLVFLALAMAPVLACSSDDSSDSGGEVRIGALVPLSGALSSYGETSRAALEEARDKINSGSSKKVTLDIQDTTTDPNMALEKLKLLSGQGIKLVVGPYASSEVAAVRDYANNNGIILISPLSTARSLAIADDNIFRFTPDDEQEGATVASLALADGIKTIIPVSRNDPGNLGLQTAMKAAYEKKGGSVVTGITYAADQTKFDTTAQDLAAILARSPAGTTGIYLTAFGEVTGLFEATGAVAGLDKVKWYGSDSVALSKDLVEAPKAAAFAVTAGYPNPILGLRDEDKSMWQPVVDKLQAKLGRTPDAFALASYDALMVGHKVLSSAGSSASAESLRKEVAKVSSSYTGLTGPMTLNPAGDRGIGIYDFWGVCRTASGGFGWARVATSTSADKVSHTTGAACS